MMNLLHFVWRSEFTKFDVLMYENVVDKEFILGLLFESLHRCELMHIPRWANVGPKTQQKNGGIISSFISLHDYMIANFYAEPDKKINDTRLVVFSCQMTMISDYTETNFRSNVIHDVHSIYKKEDCKLETSRKFT